MKNPDTAHLREWAEQIAARRGRKIAVVALARRLAGILFAMMRDGAEYKPTEHEASSQESQREPPQAAASAQAHPPDLEAAA